MAVCQDERLIDEPSPDVEQVERGEPKTSQSKQGQNNCEAILELGEAVFLDHNYGDERDKTKFDAAFNQEAYYINSG